METFLEVSPDGSQKMTGTEPRFPQLSRIRPSIQKVSCRSTGTVDDTKTMDWVPEIHQDYLFGSIGNS